ncbi:MAG: SIS domain-containing protein [Azospirillaceae bacterium]
MSLMLSEAMEIPTVVEAVLSRDDPVYADLAGRLRAEPPPFIALVGRGSSGHAANYVGSLIGVFTGRLAADVPPSLATLYDAPIVAAGALALAVSQSGKSPDLIALTERIKAGGAHTLAILNVTDSPLGHVADDVLPQHAGEERAVAATKSFVASLVAGARLVAEWTRDPALGRALERLPATLARAVACDWSAAVEALRRSDRMLVVGRGLGLGVTGEAALKLKETCALQAEAFSGAEVMHGPKALVETGYAVLGLVTAGPTARNTIDALEDLAAAGATVLQAGGPAGAGIALPLPEPLHPALDPIVQISAFYPMVARLSEARGLSPDSPRNLKKVTETM